MTTIFSSLYRKIIAWSEHPKAVYYLILVSFTESCIFPIPPDVMLISMSLAKPEKAWFYAGATTISSVLGGLFGFLLGAFFLKYLFPYIEYLGYSDSYYQVIDWYRLWGFWIVLLVGFSPIPYKIFTIASGSLHMSILPFLMASLISRGARFFLTATLLYFYGRRVRDFLEQFIEWIGWFFVIIFVFIYLWFKFLH